MAKYAILQLVELILQPSLIRELYMRDRDEGDGRLGPGAGRGPIEGGGLRIPSKVKALPAPVAAVSCGGFFTVAVTEDGKLWNWGDKGKLYMWGNVRDSQLGVLGLPEVQPSPIEVKFLLKDDGLGSHHLMQCAWFQGLDFRFKELNCS